MIRDTDYAFVSRLVDIEDEEHLGYMTIGDGDAKTKVPVTFGLVEDFLRKEVRPSINVLRLVPRFDRSRFNPRRRELVYLDDKQTEAKLLPPEQPYIVPYQVDFITEYQVDRDAMLLEVMTRFPAIGFNSYLRVGEQVLPFELVDEADLTKYETTDSRLFRYTFTYEVETWIKPLETSENVTLTKPVHHVIVTLHDMRTGTIFSRLEVNADGEGDA